MATIQGTERRPNDTTTPLANGDTFEGLWQYTEGQPTFIYALIADQNASIFVDYSNDNGVTVDSQIPMVSVASNNEFHRFVNFRRYVRIRVINDSGSDMSYMRLVSDIGNHPPATSFLNSPISEDSDTQTVRAIQTGRQPDGDFVNAVADGGAVDVGGTDVFSDTPLGAGATYTSGWCDTDGFKSIELSIKSDQISAVDGIMIEYTNDANTGTPTVDLTKTFEFNAASAALGDLTILIPPRLDGFRIKYTNGATIQGSFLLGVTLRDAPVQSVELPISSPVNKNTNALITRTVTVGETPDLEFQNSVQSGKFENGSTSTPLGVGSEFVGAFLDASKYAMLQLAIISDQYYDDTAYTDTQGNTGGVLLELSADGSTVAQSFALRVSETDVPPNYFLYFTPGRQFVRLKYTNGDTIQTQFELSLFAYISAVAAPVGVLSSGLTKFSLASQTKSAIFVENEDGSDVQMLTYSNAGQEISLTTRTLNTKAVLVAEDSAGEFGRIGRVSDAQKVYIDEIKPMVNVSVRTNNGLDSFQINVDETNAVQVPRPNVTRIDVPRKLTLTNTSSSVSVYYGYDNTVSATTGDVILPGGRVELDLGDDPYSDVASEVWVITGALAGTADVASLDADTVDSSTATNAGNQFASDDSRAVYDANSEASTISGFDATGGGVQANITSIKIKAEMRKEPSAGNETSAFVDVVGQDAGNVTSISTPTVAADPDDFYVVAISRRDEFANVTQISSTMGFTSFVLINETLSTGAGVSSAESRTSVYYAVGVPTGSGTISAAFSQAADHCAISCTRFSNIDKSDPIGGSVRFGANNSSNTYSNTVTGGVANGQFYLALGFEQGTHVSATTPAGATEKFEDGSTAGNDQSQAVITGDVSSTSSISFSGILTGSADVSYIGVALNPTPALDPVITISHSEGATTLVQSLTSETDDTYTADISADSASWSLAQIDAMALTATASNIGAANAEIDRIYLDVVSSSNVLRIPVSWLGDKP